MKIRAFHFFIFLLVVLSGHTKTNPSNSCDPSDQPDEDISFYYSYENLDLDLSSIILDQDETDEFKSSCKTVQFHTMLIQNGLQPERHLGIKAHKDLNWLDFTDLPPPVL